MYIMHTHSSTHAILDLSVCATCTCMCPGSGPLYTHKYYCHVYTWRCRLCIHTVPLCIGQIWEPLHVSTGQQQNLKRPCSPKTRHRHKYRYMYIEPTGRRKYGHSCGHLTRREPQPASVRSSPQSSPDKDGGTYTESFGNGDSSSFHLLLSPAPVEHSPWVKDCDVLHSTASGKSPGTQHTHTYTLTLTLTLKAHFHKNLSIIALILTYCFGWFVGEKSRGPNLYITKNRS